MGCPGPRCSFSIPQSLLPQTQVSGPASFPLRLDFRLHSPLQALRLVIGWLGSLQNPGWQ